MLTLVMAMPVGNGPAHAFAMGSQKRIMGNAWPKFPSAVMFSELRRHEPSLWNSYRYRCPPEAAVVEADGADGAEAGAEAWAPPAE